MSASTRADRAKARAFLPAGLFEFAIAAAALVAATLAVAAAGNSFYIYIGNQILLATIGAVGLNLLMGTAGQVSIGNAAFLTIGAFTTVLCERYGIPFPLDAAAAVLVCGLIGVLVGLPALRIRGIYLILSTMAAHFLALFLAEAYQTATVGTAGFDVDPVVGSGPLVEQQRAWAAMLLVVVLLVMLAGTWLQAGRSGRAWRMIRDRESAAPAMGIPTARYKLAAFVISSGLVGLQGSLAAHFSGNVSYESFPLTIAIAAIAMIIIGGLGSVAGSLLGAAIVTALPYLMPNLVAVVIGSALASQHAARISLMLYGILIVFFVIYARDGVRGWFAALLHRAHRARG